MPAVTVVAPITATLKVVVVVIQVEVLTAVGVFTAHEDGTIGQVDDEAGLGTG